MICDPGERSVARRSALCRGNRSLLRDYDAMTTLGAPDAAEPERVHAHAEATTGVDAHVSNEASLELEEGPVAVGTKLAAMLLAELHHLVLRLEALAVSTETAEDNRKDSVFDHLKNRNHDLRRRPRCRLVLGINVPDHEAGVRERPRAVEDVHHQVHEELTEVGVHHLRRTVNDSLQSLRDFLGIALAVDHHFENGGQKIKNPLVNISVATHDYLLFKKLSPAANRYIPESPETSQVLPAFLYIL